MYACLIALIGIGMLMNVYVARADEGYQFCDYVTPYDSFTSADTSASCRGGNIDSERLLYGVEMYMVTYYGAGDDGYLYVYDENNPPTTWDESDPALFYKSDGPVSVGDGTGVPRFFTTYFPDAVTIPSGANPVVAFRSDTGTTPGGGFYWLRGGQNITGGTDNYYRIFLWEPEPPPTPEYEAGSLEILYPTYATTTASTTVPISISYHIGTDLGQFSIDGSLPERIGIEISYDDNYDSAGYIYLETDYDIDQSPGTHSYDLTYTFPNQRTYSLQAKLILDYGYTPPYSGCVPSPPFVTCEGYQNTAVYAWDEALFSAMNGIINQIGFTPGDYDGRNALATTTCNIANISGCFQNAIAFLFFPNPDSLKVFSFLWENLKMKPPFGYVTQTLAALNNLSISDEASFSFGELPFMDSIFTPLKNGLEGMLWLSLIVGFLYRLRDLDI